MNFKPLPKTLADDITKIKAAYGILNEWYPLTLGGLHNVVLSVTAHKMKWFDKKGILREQKMDKSPDMPRYTINELTKHDRPKRPDCPFIIMQDVSKSIEWPAKLNDTGVHKTYVRMVIRTMKDGDSFSEFVKRYNMLVENKKDVFYQTYDKERQNYYSDDMELNRFIYKISRPSIERAVENQNTNTFDFIRMRIGIPSKESNSRRKEFIQKNLNGILQILLSRLNENKQYLRYGVPTDYLTIDHAVITSQDELEVVLKLKGQS